MRLIVQRLAIVGLVVLLAACARQVRARHEVAYQFEPGRTAWFEDGLAYPPKRAPEAVKRAIRAGNRLQEKPYKWGGGHAVLDDNGFDCSGAVSYVLREAGLMDGHLTSGGFFDYGKRGEGDWITVYVREGHVFLTVAGLRLDTGWGSNRSGPRWLPQGRPGRGHIMRHPSGY